MKRALSVLLLTGLMVFELFAAGVFSAQGKNVIEDQALLNEQVEEPAKEAEAEATEENKPVKKAEPEKKTQTKKENLEEKKPEPEQELSEEEVLTADYDESLLNMFDPAKDMYVRSDVNVRKGPSTEYDLVGHFPFGTLVKVLGQYGEKGWYFVEYEDQTAFVSNNYLQTDKPAEEAPVQKDEVKEQAAAENTSPVQAAKEPETEAAVQPAAVATAQPAAEALPEPASVLFIGDSRCVQMRAAVSDGGCSWICQNSKGYEWLENTALAQADRIIGKGTKVVVCLGVNDTGNVNRYASLINQKAAEWAQRGAKTYYVSVNPVTENVYRTEEEVEYFNATLPGLLSGVTWIDTHTYLIEHGFQMKDGLHYTDPSSVTIFNLIISSL